MKKGLRLYDEVASASLTAEITQMVEKGVWTPVYRSEVTGKVIRSSLFFKEKSSQTGVFEKLKARLVASGNMQDRQLYEDVSSPTVSLSSLLLLLARGASKGMKIATCDITGAYLNASMEGTEPVFMHLAPELATAACVTVPDWNSFLRPDGSMVVRLNNALYGCIESAKLWYECLREYLISLSFTTTEADQCVFTRVRDAKVLIVLLYVDDLFLLAPDDAAIDDLISELQLRFPDVKYTRGNEQNYIGMAITYTADGNVHVSMPKYVKDLLLCYDVSGSVSSPATANLFDVREAPLLAESDCERFHSCVDKLHSCVDKLLFLA